MHQKTHDKNRFNCQRCSYASDQKYGFSKNLHDEQSNKMWKMPKFV